MTKIYKENYSLIDNPDAMQKAMENLSGISSLALDLEMENHFHHYGLHIALIQISIQHGETYVFDPLSGIDIQPLGAILVDPEVELIIHDADFDKRACRRVHGWNLRNFFDTKVAAQLCGIKQYGLAPLLKELLNVDADKKFQKTDWLKRPLRRDALDYAAGETQHLFEIKDILSGRLTELNRMAWAREEFARLEHFEEHDNETPAHYKIKGSISLTPRQLAVLGAIAEFRDQLARQIGRPVHFIINNKTMMQIAATPPEDIDGLQKIHGLHPAVYRHQNAEKFIKAVKRGLTEKEELHPGKKRRPASAPGYNNRLKLMQKWRVESAASLNIEPHLLLSNDVLTWCARNPDLSIPQSVESEIREWQRNIVWDDFKKMLENLPKS